MIEKLPTTVGELQEELTRIDTQTDRNLVKDLHKGNLDVVWLMRLLPEERCLDFIKIGTRRRDHDPNVIDGLDPSVDEYLDKYMQRIQQVLLKERIAFLRNSFVDLSPDTPISTPTTQKVADSFSFPTLTP